MISLDLCRVCVCPGEFLEISFHLSVRVTVFPGSSRHRPSPAGWTGSAQRLWDWGEEVKTGATQDGFRNVSDVSQQHIRYESLHSGFWHHCSSTDLATSAFDQGSASFLVLISTHSPWKLFTPFSSWLLTVFVSSLSPLSLLSSAHPSVLLLLQKGIQLECQSVRTFLL